MLGAFIKAYFLRRTITYVIPHINIFAMSPTDTQDINYNDVETNSR